MRNRPFGLAPENIRVQPQGHRGLRGTVNVRPAKSQRRASPPAVGGLHFHVARAAITRGEGAWGGLADSMLGVRTWPVSSTKNVTETFTGLSVAGKSGRKGGDRAVDHLERMVQLEASAIAAWLGVGLPIKVRLALASSTVRATGPLWLAKS